MSNDLQYFTDIIEVNCCLGWSYENGPFQMYLLINCLISSQLLNRPFCYSNESRKKEKQNKKRKNTAKKMNRMILQLSAALGNMMINLNYLYRELLNTANCSILLPIFLFHTHFHCPFSRSLFSFTLICLIGLRLLCRRRRCYFFFVCVFHL